jgi:hypothetical protein
MIALIMGRGIEGCGVTKFSIEFAKYLKKSNIKHVSIAFDDKKWSRKHSHDTKDILRVSIENDEHFDRVQNVLNKCSKIIINSLPSLGHSDLYKDRFSSLLKLNAKYILFQHDHSRNSVQRNACLDDAIESSSVCFAHSTTNYFSKYIDDNFNQIDITNLDKEKTTVHYFQPAFDFEECKKTYWKDIKEQDAKHHKWIGRTTFWKGFEMMFDFSKELQKSNDRILTMEGIETGIVYPAFITYASHNNFVKNFTENALSLFGEKKINKNNSNPNDYTWNGKKNIADVNLENYRGDMINVFGIYKNEELLKRMSNSGFGYQLTLLNEKDILHSVEYTHLEIVASGSIPVFHKKFGDRCKDKKTNLPLTSISDTGTIWLDEDNFSNAIDTINLLEKDNVMRDEWRHMAYDFYKEHQDSQFVFDEIMEKI